MNPHYEIELFDPGTSTRAFIVIDCLIGGLASGGIRMSQHVTMDEIRDLARMMTCKNSAMNIPLGGAKVGIVGDPNAADKEKKIAAFARMAEPILRSMLLVGEDMGISSSDVKHVYHSIQFDPSKLVAEKLNEKGIQVSLLNGQSVDDLLSEEFMDYLAGFGLLEAVEEAAQHLNIQLHSATIAVQGFGTVGSGIARLLADKGAKICAISDIEGTVYNKSGFSLEELERARSTDGVIQRDTFNHYESMDTNRIFSLPVDILIPASVSNVITKENAQYITASLIVEGANMPTTEEAERMLMNKQIKILPDFIVNAGSATGFGLLITGQANMDTVFKECAKRIRQTIKEILVESDKQGKSTREIAEKLAESNLKRLLEQDSKEGSALP